MKKVLVIGMVVVTAGLFAAGCNGKCCGKDKAAPATPVATAPKAVAAPAAPAAPVAPAAVQPVKK